MGVDFVKSDSGNNRPKGNGYDIEYTDPKAEEDIPKVKHGNLLSWMSKGSGTVPPVVSEKTVPAASSASATMPSTQIRRTAAYRPVAATTVAKQTKTRAEDVSTNSAPAPVTTKLMDHHLPPPPPPPVHSAAPVLPVEVKPAVVSVPPQTSQTPTPTPRPYVPPVVPTVQPVAPAPMPVTPVMAPAIPSAPIVQPEPVKITHVLPPPPPAPDHTVPAVPVASAQPTQAPVAPAPILPASPAGPMPAPMRPAGAIAAAAPMAAQRHVTSVGEIVAQNVTGMRGETTHPDLSEPELFGVNLLPNATNQPLQQTPFYRMLRASTVMVMLCTLIYLAMVAYQGFFIWRTHNTLAELTGLDSEIVTYRTLQSDINQTSTTLAAIQDLLNDHLYWSQWFSFLEEYTLPNVYYSNFSGSANGTMNLQAVAPDFTTISQQIAVFKALPEVLDVTVTTATRSDTNFADTTGDPSSGASDTVQFTISLQVDPAILHFQPNGLYEQSQ